MAIQKGDLIFVRGHKPVDELIEWAENGVYSHVAISHGDGRVLEAQGGRRIGYAPLTKYAGTFDVGHVENATDAQRDAAIKAAEKRIGWRYAWRLIFVLIVKLLFHVDLPYRSTQELICSNYALDVWRDAGVNLTNADKPTPQDIADSPRITIQKA